MSFTISNKLSVKVDEKKNDGKKDAEKSKRGFGAKQNPLLTAKTENYVDDIALYNPRISRDDRLRYFEFIIKAGKQWKTKKKQKTAAELNENEELNYPKFYTNLLRFVRSNRWDQLYLNLLLLFIILIAVFDDDAVIGMLGDSIASFRDMALMCTLLGMLGCALVPCLGTAYFVHYCNDLTLYMASLDFTNWAFAATLTAQYIEYFYYGGRNRRVFASNLRADRVRNNPRPIVNRLRVVAERFLAVINVLRARNHGKIEPEDEEASGSQETGGDSVEGEGGSNAGEGKEGKEHQNSKLSKLKREGDNKVDAAKSNVHDDKGSEYFDEFDEELKGPPVEMVEWTCVVCNTFNPSTRKIPLEQPEVDLYFGTHGLHFKRLFTKMVPRPHKAICSKCSTPHDYQPPIGSSHLFQFYSEPYGAFSNYPHEPILHHGLRTDLFFQLQQKIYSCLYGIHNSDDSLPVLNDWRLRKWVADKFPPLPRYVLKEGEKYEQGEVVECKLQKSEYYRAKIVNVRPNNLYDIRYDTGDELRFVEAEFLRLGAEKGALAYRIEILMVGFYIWLPLGLFMSVSTHNSGFVFLGPLIIGVTIFLMRLNNFLQYCYNYYHAGLCVIVRATAFFTLSPFFLFLVGAVGFMSGSDLASAGNGITALIILTLLSALPVMYIIKPPFAIIGIVIFSQVAIGCVLLSMYTASPADSFPLLAIPLAPFYTTILSLKYLRYHLHAIWDTCLVIRPAIDHSKQNPNIWLQLFDRVEKTITYYLP